MTATKSRIFLQLYGVCLLGAVGGTLLDRWLIRGNWTAPSVRDLVWIAVITLGFPLINTSRLQLDRRLSPGTAMVVIGVVVFAIVIFVALLMRLG